MADYQYYISNKGSDSNDGLTELTPLLTESALEIKLRAVPAQGGNNRIDVIR